MTADAPTGSPTTTVRYPSPLVPGPPPISLEVPAGWEQVWAPETLVAAREEDDGEGRFLANVVVRHLQRSAPFGPDEVAAELGDYVRGKGGQLSPLREGHFDDRPWVGAELTFIGEEVGPVGQVHWFTGRDLEETVAVLQVTGTYDLTRRDEHLPVLEAVIGSIRVED